LAALLPPVPGKLFLVEDGLEYEPFEDDAVTMPETDDYTPEA
jgi:hypothetical protein